eukprot:2524279-Pleurochrysis_carterae.AAC.2
MSKFVASADAAVEVWKAARCSPCVPPGASDACEWTRSASLRQVHAKASATLGRVALKDDGLQLVRDT